jgi:hypothetical protein
LQWVGQQGRKTAMISMSRRSVIRGSLGLAATGTLARPYIANAQAKTAVFWAGEDAKSFCRSFFDWYNKDHHHAGGWIDPCCGWFVRRRRWLVNEALRVLAD